MQDPEGSHRTTRSRAAPEWTAEESLILANEIHAVESEWGPTLPSFQKWQQIVENCNALDVSRSLDQCRRHWDALLTAYRNRSSGDWKFSAELLDAIDRCVNGKGRVNVEEEEEELVVDTDTEDEAEARANRVLSEAGSKKRRCRMKRKRRKIEKQNPWGYITSAERIDEEPSSINENMANTEDVVVESEPEDSNAETKEQMMASLLWENAVQINKILEGNIADEVDYKLADLKNPKAVQTDFTRRQGDRLIDCLGKISGTLNQLCDLVQQCK